jgi:hypothetical protein
VIEPTVFSRWMGALAERVGKRLTEDTNAVYYAVLSAELDTAQFEQAMRLAFRDHAYATWPSPKEIIDRVVRPVPVAVEGAAAWRTLVERLRGRDPREQWHSLLADLERLAGRAAVQAFHAAGGFGRWIRASDEDVDWMRKEFLQHYGGERQVASVQGTLNLDALPDAVRGMITGTAAGMNGAPKALREGKP